MWRRAGGAVACALCWLLACGKAERQPSDSDTDDAGSSTGGVASAGTANTNSGGKASAAAGAAGTTASVGGAVTLGGRASAGNPSGGEAEAGMPATGGEPSAGGAPSCEGAYRACGCGCCAGQTAAITCAYPAKGDDLAAIIAADEEASQSPLCAAAGCSAGLDYVCCEAPPPVADQALYVATVTIGGVNRLELRKEMGVCTNLVLVQPSVAPTDLPLETPATWTPDLARSRHLPCSASSLGPKAIGAIGKLGLRVLGNACVLDAHLTLFFANVVQDVQAERFDVDALPLNLSLAECH
ncbi:MAG TPA: hypothetical protein VHP33_10030 [Polyangiaceae bacterium]|nr:hypothetical protein [Polyangiaceae bacterium]